MMINLNNGQGKSRIEHDFLGEKEIPDQYYFGVQIYRDLENFKISGVTLDFFPELIQALGMVKQAAAVALRDMGEIG